MPAVESSSDSPSPPAQSRASRLFPGIPRRALIVPVVLILVASYHLFGFFQHNRSSWGTGVGFGMFATSDAHGTRWIVVHRHADSFGQNTETSQVDSPKPVREVMTWMDCKSLPYAAKALAIPTQSRVDRAAEALGGDAVIYGVRFEPSSWTIRSYEIARSQTEAF